MIMESKIKKLLDNTQIKDSVSDFFYNNLILSLERLYKIDEISFINDFKFINDNIKLFQFLEKIIHIEMILSFSPYKCNDKYTILYKKFYNIYINNKKNIENNMRLDFGINTPWLKYILLSENITNITNLKNINKNLIFTFSFFPTSTQWSEESEDGVWSLGIEFYISDNDIKIETGYVEKKYIYEKLWRSYYSWNFYIWLNDILISSLEGKHLNYKKHIWFSLNNFILSIFSKVKLNLIWLSNESHFCKHHKNFWWNYNNIFSKYGFWFNHEWFYETKNMKLNKIDYDFDKFLNIFYKK